MTLQSEVGWSCSHLKVWDKGVYFQGDPLMWLASWCLSMGLHGCSHDMAAPFPKASATRDKVEAACRVRPVCGSYTRQRCALLVAEVSCGSQSPREEVSSRTRIAWATGGFLQGRGVFELRLKVRIGVCLT